MPSQELIRAREMGKVPDRIWYQVNGKTAFDAMLAGDNTGKAVVAEYIEYLATGLINVINIFQPDVLCIGGGMGFASIFEQCRRG